MQSCRRGGNGSTLRCVDGLVALPIGRIIVTLDVGRQRNVANAIDRFVHARPVVGPQSNAAASMEVASHDLAVKPPAVTFEDDARAGFQLLTGRTRREKAGTTAAHTGRTFEQQALHGAAARHPVSEQARGKHTCVVDYQEIAATEIPAKVRETVMLDATIRTGKDEEARPAAF